jgi:hypothetical protein
MQDALRTLHLLDALDIKGGVTPTGKAMAALPLDPGLARCMLAAVELRCAIVREVCIDERILPLYYLPDVSCTYTVVIVHTQNIHRRQQ